MKAVLSQNFLCLLVFVGAVFADPVFGQKSFLECCKDKKIQNSCQPFCSYSKNADEVLKAFENKKCNFDTEGPAYYQCLENLKDNRACCKRNGVGANPLLEFCLDKCNGKTPIKPDHKYFKCKQYSQTIRDCGRISHLLY